MNSNKKEKNHSTAVKLDVLEYNTILVYVGNFLPRVADAFQSDNGKSFLTNFFIIARAESDMHHFYMGK